MPRRKNTTFRESFKRGERGYVKFPCPQCGKELLTPIDFPGWYECPACKRGIFWREARMIAVRVKSGKCEELMERNVDVRALQEQIESLEAENEQLRETAKNLCDELERAREGCTSGYQIRAAAGRFWQEILHWKFVVLILAIEAVRLAIDISRFGH